MSPVRDVESGGKSLTQNQKGKCKSAHVCNVCGILLIVFICMYDMCVCTYNMYVHTYVCMYVCMLLYDLIVQFGYIY